MLFWGHYITLIVTFKSSGDFNCSLGRIPPLAHFLGQFEPSLSYPGTGFGVFLAGCGSLSACWGHVSGQTGGDDMLGCLTAVLGGHIHKSHGHTSPRRVRQCEQSPHDKNDTTKPQHETTQQNTNNRAVKG